MSKLKKFMVPGAVAVAGFVGVSGGSLLSSLSANAASATGSNTDASSQTQPAERDLSQGGHVANGTTETLLTGDTAAKVKAAAEAAVPGATVLRVENDAEGATYEAHMQKSDGSQVTVKMDANFKVTGTETGFSGHGQGRPNDNDADGTT